VRGDTTFAAERVWENEGGRLRRLERGAPQSPGPARVRVRRIYEPVTEQDGIRVLVDRLWPRGMSKTRAQIHEWCRDIAPSTALRRWYGHDAQRFTLLHLSELADGRTLTLLTASRDPAISEAVVLAELLEKEPRSR
jgi:uncharacterized protein YeaO (DUF488 family)